MAGRAGGNHHEGNQDGDCVIWKDKVGLPGIHVALMLVSAMQCNIGG